MGPSSKLVGPSHQWRRICFARVPQLCLRLRFQRRLPPGCGWGPDRRGYMLPIQRPSRLPCPVERMFPGRQRQLPSSPCFGKPRLLYRVPAAKEQYECLKVGSGQRKSFETEQMSPPTSDPDPQHGTPIQAGNVRQTCGAEGIPLIAQTTFGLWPIDYSVHTISEVGTMLPAA